jgi:ATP-binding cassette subfamily B protein
LLRVLRGLLPKHAGQIRWQGGIVSEPASFVVPPRCTHIPQTPPRRTGSLTEQILSGLSPESTALPEWLVCDDLSNTLDVQTERRLWDQIFRYRLFARSGACLAVSHRRPALRRADHILVLVEGRVAAEGTLCTLLSSSAQMRNIWRGGLE